MLTDLERVVGNISPLEACVPDAVGLRHGWATEQALAALRDARDPLSVADVRAAVTERTGYALKHSTVRYILRHGALAKSRRIVQARERHYALAASHE